MHIRRDEQVGGRYRLAIVKCALALMSCLLPLHAPVSSPRQALGLLANCNNDGDSYSVDYFHTARWRQGLVGLRRSESNLNGSLKTWLLVLPRAGGACRRPKLRGSYLLQVLRVSMQVFTRYHIAAETIVGGSSSFVRFNYAFHTCKADSNSGSTVRL